MNSICKTRKYNQGAKNTLIPVFVASREASNNGLNMGLNATVNAQSTICPEKLTSNFSYYVPKKEKPSYIMDEIN